jgi:hypothetical protein
MNQAVDGKQLLSVSFFVFFFLNCTAYADMAIADLQCPRKQTFPKKVRVKRDVVPRSPMDESDKIWQHLSKMRYFIGRDHYR